MLVKQYNMNSEEMRMILSEAAEHSNARKAEKIVYKLS